MNTAVMTFDLIALIHRQRALSLRCDGPGKRADVVFDHLLAEVAVLRKAPQDPYQWADMVLLVLDGAWRAGHEPEEIAAALAGTLADIEREQMTRLATLGDGT